MNYGQFEFPYFVGGMFNVEMTLCFFVCCHHFCLIFRKNLKLQYAITLWQTYCKNSVALRNAFTVTCVIYLS